MKFTFLDALTDSCGCTVIHAFDVTVNRAELKSNGNLAIIIGKRLPQPINTYETEELKMHCL